MTKTAKKKAAAPKGRPPRLTIDPEFSEWLPEPTAEEEERLQRSLKEHGCRHPIVVWQHDGKPVILDGHRRYRFCTAHKIPYEVEYLLRIESRDDAFLWMIRNQLERRNLDPAGKQASALRGKEWNLLNPGPGRPKLRHDGVNISKDKFAELHGVSPRTIDRDSEFANSLDVIRETCGEGDMHKVLKSGAHRHEILALSKQSAQSQRTLIDVLESKGNAAFRTSIEKAVKASAKVDYHAKLNRLIAHIQREVNEFPRDWWANVSDALAGQADILVSRGEQTGGEG